MAKYQLGDHDFLHSGEGAVYPARSVQVFPDTLEPSLTWTPLDAAADAALKALAAKKTKAAKERAEMKTAPDLPVFKTKPLASAMPAAKAEEVQVYSMSDAQKGKRTRHSDEDKL